MDVIKGIEFIKKVGSINVKNDLYKTTKIVKSILEEDRIARNSDSYLYLRVLLYVGRQKNIDVKKISIAYFLIHRKELGFPSYKSVCRSRRKLQSTYRELAGCDKVEAQKVLNEEIYREYAKELLIWDLKIF